MYYQYWNLIKPPFDNVPDPSMYVDCHASMENAIAETLFAIEEGGDSLAVIVGDVGLGKTLSLRMIIDSLEQERYKIALITNPGITFCQLLKEIIGQLTGIRCDVGRKGDLLETFNKLLFDTIDEGRRVLIFIDEANAISPANLESLRLLTNMQDDQINLFTVILAGQMELARRLEHPKRKNLFQRIGTYNRIDKIHSENLVKNYVETRLKLAGGTTRIFADDAFVQLWEHSEHGVPRLINKISKLSLKAGETNEFNEITGDIVGQIGERFRKLTRQAIQRRRPRKRFEKEVIRDQCHEAEPVLVAYGRDNSVPVIEQLKPVESIELV
ncbi:MAG: AAA family ATPase, partial [Deltaproteobacteria bacterium]|nr:AAA family ATPase [Deltaproteobacteria bacterium]